jgi:hypothetical protein
MKSRLLLWLGLAAVAALVACGTPGAPQPPSLELRRPVRDLAATRKGDRVLLTWTAPQENADHTRVRHSTLLRVCRGVDVTAMTGCPEIVAQLQAPPPGTQPVKLEFTDALPKPLQQQHPTGFATYAIEALNPRGRSAGLGNQVRVPLAPTLPHAQKLLARVTAQGVVVSWVVPPEDLPAFTRTSSTNGGIQYRFVLHRRDPDSPRAAVVEIPTTSASVNPNAPQPDLEVMDTTVEWEHRYVYWVVVRTVVLTADGKPQAMVDGDDSPPVEVFVHDIFPPERPTGLQAVFSGLEQQKFIDLTWTPNSESDLTGYNVYRHEQGTQPVKINGDLVKTPAFRDTRVESGHRYFYSVTAVDLRGNESAPSEEASEAVP